MNPLVGVLWGVFVFGERPRGGTWIVGELLGAAVIVAAPLLLVRSPVLQRPAGSARRALGPRRPRKDPQATWQDVCLALAQARASAWMTTSDPRETP
jgi:drug/metabolite transporter (DMT)-like permease